MKQEDKDLLLKDLCARLPYGVIVREYFENGQIDINPIDCGFYYILDHTDKVRPYLRPMSSITVKEKDELFTLCTMCNGGVDTYWEAFGVEIISTHPRFGDYYSTDYKVIDWLNKKMFDYRGLIPKGLAIAITESNNPYNNDYE